MEIRPFFFQVIALDKRGEVEAFRGTAFPVTPAGGLLTCRHVVASPPAAGGRLVLADCNGTVVRDPIGEIRCMDSEQLDLAFIAGNAGRADRAFLPILTPSALLVGEGVFSHGFYEPVGREAAGIRTGYFSGKIIGFTTERGGPSLTLPYAVLEGMSGSPVMTYHNGHKVVGVGYGNNASRILAHEVHEVEDGTNTFKETIHRIVEFGAAYHAGTIVAFLDAIGAKGYVVSDGRVNLPGLE